MQYRKMGNLNWESGVSALGFGCMRLPKKFGHVDEEESIRILRYGIDRGINYVDTAQPYHMGQSEIIVGKALKDGYREKVHLVTKLPVWSMKTVDDFDKLLNQQLKKLQTDYLDIYLFHGINKVRFEKIKKLNLIDKMEQAKAEGKIKRFGFSFHDSLSVFREIVDYYDWDCCQIQYNYMDTGIQATTEGLEYAYSKGMAVIIMEPVKGGTLAKPPKEALEIMNKSSIKRTPVDWALQFLWNKQEIAVVLSGMSNMQQVVENCDSAEKSGINTLSPEEVVIVDELADYFTSNTAVPCTGCGYCMDCPNGVYIPENFSIINNIALSHGNSLGSIVQRVRFRSKYRKMAKSKEDLINNLNNGRASMCINCGVCIEKCPQQIQIPTELAKVVQVMEKRRSILKVFIKK
jgi:predicted aldo/keto reductase-like oxidoreductase